MSVWHPLKMPQVSFHIGFTMAAEIRAGSAPQFAARREVKAVLEITGALPSEVY